MRSGLQTGSCAVLMPLMLFIGILALWVGVPLGWLYAGSLVQHETDSIGTALAAMTAGVILNIALLLPLLGWLNRKHDHLHEARGLESHGQTAIEAVLVTSAGLAVLIFGIWFFFIS